MPSLSRDLKSHKWLLTFAAATLISVLFYLVNILVSEVEPYSTWGLGYGIAASAMVSASILYAVRRRMINVAQKVNAGRTISWRQFHQYAGLLFLLLMFMHTGFRLPSDVLTWGLWCMGVLTAISGLVGMGLQKWIPRLLTNGVDTEVHFDRIPELITEINDRAASLCETCDPRIRDFYVQDLAPALAHEKPRLTYYLDIKGAIQTQTRAFSNVRRILSDEQAQDLSTLEGLFRTKLEMDAQLTLQKSLRWWLYAHIPVSIILFALMVLHIFSVLYY